MTLFDIVENAHFVTVGLLCEDYEGELSVMEPDKITKWQWFDMENLPDPLYFPSARIIENYNNKQFYMAR